MRLHEVQLCFFDGRLANFIINSGFMFNSVYEIKENFLTTSVLIDSSVNAQNGVAEGSPSSEVFTLNDNTVPKQWENTGKTEIMPVADQQVTFSIFQPVRDRMVSSSSGSLGYSYIVSGDSTRDNSYNEMISYYTAQLAKINMTVVDNANSGESAQEWLNSQFGGLNSAIAATDGTGNKTILEYSYGINDYGVNTIPEIKNFITQGLTQYLAAKPDAAVMLCTPVATSGRLELNAMYQEIANEMSLPLIDVNSATSSVHGNSDYYFDATHPNLFGSARVVNYILSESTDPSLYGTITLDEYPPVLTPPVVSNLATPIEIGLYSSTTGAPLAHANWRRMQISVEPNFAIKINHQGNRVDAILLDSSGNMHSYISYSKNSPYVVPTGVFGMRLNISSNGAAYDLLNDTPLIEYVQPSSVNILTQAQINLGLSINLLGS